MSIETMKQLGLGLDRRDSQMPDGHATQRLDGQSPQPTGEILPLIRRLWGTSIKSMSTTATTPCALPNLFPDV
jgi:hypothetical protein